MMIDRIAIIKEAREWIDTPFAHQAHTKGIATDCRGLIGGVAIAVGLLEPVVWEREFADYSGYARTPSGGMLERVCREHMREIDAGDAQPGDVLLMRFVKEPQHLAILAPYALGGLSMIHAWSRAKPARVIEHRYADVWRARTVAAFVLPGVA